MEEFNQPSDLISYDFTDIAKSLGQNKNTRNLSKRLKRLITLNSILYDLEGAQDAVRLIFNRYPDAIEKIDISSDDAIFDRSLATLAIISYSRATDTSSDVRGRFDPRKYYSGEMVEWHNSIIKLRNEAIAHYGSGRHIGGNWASDRLFFQVSPSQGFATFVVFGERANFRGRAINELAILLPLALQGLNAERAALTVKCAEEVDALAGAGRALWREATRANPPASFVTYEPLKVLDDEA